MVFILLTNWFQELKKLRNDSPKHKLAAQALYNVQNKFKMLLPDVELDAGEVIRIGKAPIGGTAEFDFWEGLYLDKEKCLLKTIRTANFNEKQKAVSANNSHSLGE